MAGNSGTDRELTQINYCVYVDDHNTTYFCVADFIRKNHLSDAPGLRRRIADDVKTMFLGVLILEEQILEEQN